MAAPKDAIDRFVGYINTSMNPVLAAGRGGERPADATPLEALALHLYKLLPGYEQNNTLAYNLGKRSSATSRNHPPGIIRGTMKGK